MPSLKPCMTASRCAAARSTRASHSSALHSSRLMRETWSCTLISLLLSRGSYGGDTEKYHAASTRSPPVEPAASSVLSSSPELRCPRDRGSFRRPAHRCHHPGHCSLLERGLPTLQSARAGPSNVLVSGEWNILAAEVRDAGRGHGSGCRGRLFRRPDGRGWT